MEGTGDKATAEGMELLRKEVEKLKEELKTAGEGQCRCIFPYCVNICVNFTDVLLLFLFCDQWKVDVRILSFKSDHF